MIPALVLAAGLATRLRPLSFVRAKAAVPVAGEPLVRRVLRWLRAAGVADVVLNLHHLPHTITEVLGDGSDLGVCVRYSWENPVLGTAGGPRRALPIVGAPTLLIVNGDTLTNVDLDALVAEHRRSGARVTMAVVPNRWPDKYSGLAVDRDGSVVGTVPRGAAEPSYHFFGVQVVEASAFASVPEGTPYESVGQLYPALTAADPGSVRAYCVEAECFDVGTPADYLATSLDIAAREGRSPSEEGAQIEDGALVERSVLWRGAVVEAGALVRECVVAGGARVPSDTSWHGVTIRPAGGETAPGERRIGDLLIGSL
jgi:NDP-sugar pyrophosphorylase family protein